MFHHAKKKGKRKIGKKHLGAILVIYLSDKSRLTKDTFCVDTFLSIVDTDCPIMTFSEYQTTATNIFWEIGSAPKQRNEAHRVADKFITPTPRQIFVGG